MKTATTTPPANPHTLTTENDYPKLAFCSAITPATPEHYEHLLKAGIDTVSICLHLSGRNYYKFATIHTSLARGAGLTTHAFMVTDLAEPMDDVMLFTKRYDQLGYTSGNKITIWLNSNEYIPNREERLAEIMDMLSNYHNRENIDVAFFKRDLDAGLYDFSKIPKLINLTIINCENNATSSGVPVAGTWVHAADFAETVQYLAYDYYGYYTGQGYQLSLVDTDYVVQPGDTWHSISRRHGIPLLDLLALNRATATDKIYAGQIVRIA